MKAVEGFTGHWQLPGVLAPLLLWLDKCGLRINFHLEEMVLVQLV